MSEQQNTVYRVYPEKPAEKPLDEVLRRAFARHAIDSSQVQVEFDMNGALLQGITEEEAENIGGSNGINSCQPEAGAKISMPGFLSR